MSRGFRTARFYRCGNGSSTDIAPVRPRQNPDTHQLRARGTLDISSLGVTIASFTPAIP
jgi:hypothetical protein